MTRIFSKRRKPVLETIGQILILLSFLVAVAYGAHVYPADAILKAVMKGAAVGLLALFVLMNIRSVNHFLLFLALAASVAGDVLLALPIEQAFVKGLLAFGGAHVVFLLLYMRNRLPGREMTRPRINAATLVWVATGIAYFLMWPHLGALLWYVVGYSALLALMATSAILSIYPPRLVGLGAILFLVSDALLGARQFLDVPAVFGYLVWASYYLAQLLMTLGVMLAEDRRSSSFGTYRFD
ncbi:MAG: lysoplasmalogenase [Alphaproteobacteria bacterium]|nr:MAG: lysoplasmalogenase [Alphaproteobacteria bacterium]